MNVTRTILATGQLAPEDRAATLLVVNSQA